MQKKIGYVEGLYTLEELKKAVEDEREACVDVCDNLAGIDGYVLLGVERCIGAIRARGKE